MANERPVYPAPRQDPVTGEPLVITRLEGPTTGIAIEGRFSFGSGSRLDLLSPEHLAFVEVFIKSRGIIKDVEAELGISYPTVRARLDEVIRAMGYAPYADDAPPAEGAPVSAEQEMHIQGEERDDVAVTITCEPADAIGRDLEILLEERDETIHAEVRGPDHGGSFFGHLRGNVRIAMEIHTPLRSDIEAEGASTSMHLERLEGTIRARTASGDVRADRLTKMVTIQTASGDIRAHAFSGSVRLQSASGDIGLERGDGAMSIQSASGNLEFDHLTGTLDVSTASGDCLVRASALASCRAKTASGDLTIATPLAPNGEYDISTVSGDLLLQVPQETRMTVGMRTVNGDLSCALPATSDGGKRNRTLTVNGGGVPVIVKSVSGDCAIRAASNNLPALPILPA
ncbi:MAG: DUF2089 family protein, partial [Thermomicrobia bacterium]|nr:DUF2089 family protein [Thermomicrobia bacterium]